MLKEDELVGKTVDEILINSDKTETVLKCKEGYYLLAFEGDCCSETWVEHTNISDMVGKTIEEVSSVTMGEVVLCPTKQDEDILYCTKFKFTPPNRFGETEAIIEYRNSSSGYYGGSLELYKLESTYDFPDFNKLNANF